MCETAGTCHHIGSNSSLGRGDISNIVHQKLPSSDHIHDRFQYTDGREKRIFLKVNLMADKAQSTRN